MKTYNNETIHNNETCELGCRCQWFACDECHRPVHEEESLFHQYAVGSTGHVCPDCKNRLLESECPICSASGKCYSSCSTNAGCDACMEAEEIQPGHFLCRLPWNIAVMKLREESGEVYRYFDGNSWMWADALPDDPYNPQAGE